jgi:hypothetical protein
VAEVRVEVRGGPTLLATVNDGWFGAYWGPELRDCPIVDSEDGAQHVCPEVHVRALAVDDNGVVVSSIDFDVPARQP